MCSPSNSFSIVSRTACSERDDRKRRRYAFFRVAISSLEKPRSFQADDVQPVKRGPVPCRHYERRDVLRYAGKPAHEGVLAYLTELVDRAKTRKDSEIVHVNVAPEGRAVRHDYVVADNAVVRDVAYMPL